jgi:hypothetical protein
MTVCRIIRTGNLQTGWALECNRQLIRTHPSAAVLGAYIDAILAGVNEYDADTSPRRSRDGHYLRMRSAWRCSHRREGRNLREICSLRLAEF